MISMSLFECHKKIANTLKTQFGNCVDPQVLDDIVAGVCLEVSRAYQLGSKKTLQEVIANGEQGLKALEKLPAPCRCLPRQ